METFDSALLFKTPSPSNPGRGACMHPFDGEKVHWTFSSFHLTPLKGREKTMMHSGVAPQSRRRRRASQPGWEESEFCLSP